MKHKGLIGGTSIGLGLLIFSVFYFFEGLTIAIVGGSVTVIGCAVFMIGKFKRSGIATENLKERLKNQAIEYIDTASVMIENKELMGALAVTNHAVFFSWETEKNGKADRITTGNIEDKQESIWEFPYKDIKEVENSKGILLLTDNKDITYRFKVFHCDTIVELIKGRKS